jgi:beta-glucanase (GH16 family)
MRVSFVVILLLFAHNFLNAKDFKGAEYRTKQSYTYGRFEANYKSPYREGVLASFFTYHDGGISWNEIDIEIMGRYDNDVQFNTITPGQTNHVRHQFVDFNPHLDFHTYAFEWTPDYVAWFIDGEEVYRQTGAHISTLNLPQKIMMNIWNPVYENWAGKWNPDILPSFAYYDWVSYYSYTPGAGSYGTGNNFTHQWTDNFDSWDQSRWDKATHTFGGNNCDFIRENAVFNDGKLILCLTDAVNIGYIDKKAPNLLWARAYDNGVLASFTEELDKLSAESKSNYIISNAAIDSIKLLEDEKNVFLYSSNINLSGGFNLIVLSMKDKANPPNTMPARAVPVILPSALKFPIKINIGGQAVNDFIGDTEFKETTEYGYMDGQNTVFPSSLHTNNTEYDYVYRSERYGLAAYKIRVPPGSYSATLMFAENYFTQTGRRIFDVYVEGKRVIDNLDIFSQLGTNYAYELKAENILCLDGIIDIHFSSEIENPLINGIIVENNTTGFLEEDMNHFNSFALEQNYPNPFNGATKIGFSIKEESAVQLKIFNVTGKIVYSENLGTFAQGKHEIQWHAKSNLGISLNSGVYIYSLENGKHTLAKKLILLN